MADEKVKSTIESSACQTHEQGYIKDMSLDIFKRMNVM